MTQADAGHVKPGTDEPDGNGNAPTLPPPEAWCVGYGRSGRDEPPINFSGLPLPTIRARPPALRSRCGRMVYQYESTDVNTVSG